MSLVTKNWLAVAFFVAALAVVGYFDHRDAELEAQHYCDMVRSGYWPNYQGVDCKK